MIDPRELYSLKLYRIQRHGDVTACATTATTAVTVWMFDDHVSWRSTMRGPDIEVVFAYGWLVKQYASVLEQVLRQEREFANYQLAI
jgi:hypothetical protein